MKLFLRIPQLLLGQLHQTSPSFLLLHDGIQMRLRISNPLVPVRLHGLLVNCGLFQPSLQLPALFIPAC